ncbi:hypothetical protein [Glycomyces artemisiae]|uniref:Uncharacterized protein n=1 Tax=Glycomyces artemisiae TaxID=1076443 RepID=A0A2T0U6H4_9ACTN|nr:hypothetical protein [Glycomyces artemisiae]PRY53507.1 hypothetical protein B0I28_1176 [Glycomyces artemisiae]
MPRKLGDRARYLPKESAAMAQQTQRPTIVITQGNSTTIYVPVPGKK